MAGLSLNTDSKTRANAAVRASSYDCLPACLPRQGKAKHQARDHTRERHPADVHHYLDGGPSMRRVHVEPSEEQWQRSARQCGGEHDDQHREADRQAFHSTDLENNAPHEGGATQHDGQLGSHGQLGSYDPPHRQAWVPVSVSPSTNSGKRQPSDHQHGTLAASVTTGTDEHCQEVDHHRVRLDKQLKVLKDD
eukprot:CAMPEP_0179104916 /NCGR_PEP_ID=MMETSP0796-20121207/48700_1 /TAXON_ID=73915 /ORGANISM="Pyrodinium bahamense, Strain pbaha01" /LENGTH=192 /DNA_ID=CAMNT_0020802889 /DNA_START=120 /DNA_END=698 /DNA_ORIENTATION=+